MRQIVIWVTFSGLQSIDCKRSGLNHVSIGEVFMAKTPVTVTTILALANRNDPICVMLPQGTVMTVACCCS